MGVLEDVPVKYRLSTMREVHENRLLFLSYLYERGGDITSDSGIPASETAPLLGISDVGVSSAMRDMEALGVIKRTVHGRRTKAVRLTPLGCEVVEHLMPPAVKNEEPEPQVVDITDEPEEFSDDGVNPEAIADALLEKVLAITSGRDEAVETLTRQLTESQEALRTAERAHDADTRELTRRVHELEGQVSESTTLERTLRAQLGQANEQLVRLNSAVERLRRRGGGAGLKPEAREALAEIARTMQEPPRGR